MAGRSDGGLPSWLSARPGPVDGTRRRRGGRSSRRYPLDAASPGLEDRRLLSTFAVTRTADDGGAGTLRWAIRQADAATSPSTIAFDLTGTQTIVLEQGPLVLSNPDTADAIAVDVPTGSLSLTVVGGAGPVFKVAPDTAAMISGLTITGGSNPDQSSGGGIVNQGILSLSGCTISGNSAWSGGGLYNAVGGTVTIRGGTIGGNSAGSGGGITNDGTLSVVGTTFLGNRAEGLGGAFYQDGPGRFEFDACRFTGNDAASSGGAISADDSRASGSIWGCRFTGNGAGDFGGAISVSEGTLTIANSTFTGNSSQRQGGALILDNNSPGHVTVTGCTISGNTSEVGGGAMIAGPGTTFDSCTIGGNRASFAGGGLATDAGAAVSLENCTIAGNTAAAGGGVDNAGTLTLDACTIGGNTAFVEGGGLDNLRPSTDQGGRSSDPAAILTDTIVAGNSAAHVAGDIAGAGGAAVTGTYNLIGPGGSGGMTGGADGNIVLTDLSGLDLGPLSEGGGLTPTMALLPGSPAIGAGTAVVGITSDQRGLPIDSPSPDIGAYQTQPGNPTVLTFAGLSSPSITFGTASATISGTLSAGAQSPPGTESVQVTLDGVTQQATLDAGGAFSTTFDTGALGAAHLPYTIACTYAGDGTFAPATAATSLWIAPATPTVGVSDAGGPWTGGPLGATATVAGVGAAGPPAATLEGVSPTLAYYSGSTATGPALSSAPGAPGTYTVVVTYAGDADYTPASTTTTFTITPAALVVPTFAGLSSPSITFGTASATISGTLSAGVQAPPATESVRVTLDGVSQQATLGSGGAFSTTFDTSALPAAGSPYTVDYLYITDGTYATATATSLLGVDRATPTVSVSDPGGPYTGNPYAPTVTVTGVAGPGGTSLDGVTPVLSYDVGSPATGAALPGAPSLPGTYTVFASMTGSPNYTGATGSASFTITPSALVGLSFGGLSSPSITYGTASVTLSGTLSAVDQAPPATELVRVTLDGVTRPAAIGAGGAFSTTFDTGALPVSGSPYTISYAYAGDATYAAAAATGTISVTKATPTVRIYAPGGPYTGNAFSPTVILITAAGPAGSDPEGGDTSLFYDEGGQLVSGTPVVPGTYRVDVNFGGSADYTSASGSATFTITPGILTALSLGGSTAPSLPYGSTSLTVSGTLAAGGQGPAGEGLRITFNGTTQTAAIGPGGAFSSTFTGLDGLSIGTAYDLAYAYDGDATYAPARFDEAVPFVKATPTLTVTDAGGTDTGRPYPAAVTVAGTTGPAGPGLEGVSPTLAYYAGATATGTPLLGPPTAAGIYTVVAAFAGSTHYAAVRSAPLVFTISSSAPPSSAPPARVTPSVALAWSTASATFGQAITLIATVTADGTTPTGTVTFSDGGRVLGTAALDAAGRAALTTTALSAGDHAITAAYGGDSVSLAATSSPAAGSVAQAPVQVVLVPRPIFQKKKVVSLGLEADVQPTSSGGGTPAGTVIFEVMVKGRGKKARTTAKVLGSAALSGGSATLMVKTGAVLKKTMTVIYGGDGDFLAGSTATMTLSPASLKSLARPMMSDPGRAGGVGPSGFVRSKSP